MLTINNKALKVRATLILGCLITAFTTIFYITLPDVGYLIEHNPQTTAFIKLRKAEAAKENLLFNLKWEWICLNEVSPQLQQLVILSEDPDFWVHKGISWKNIKKAVLVNWRDRKIKRGGSSISQQTAKNLYLSPRKTFTRKMHECLITWQLEYYLSKQRILEIYLNIAEWGDGIFGIKAAALHWFHKSPSDLTSEEALFLSSLLPSPILKKNSNYTQ